MKLRDIVCCQFFHMVISFCVLFLFLFGGICSAESPGIKIIEPIDGSTVTPGQEIIVRIESVGGFELEDGLIGVSDFFQEDVIALPANFVVNIPSNVAGKIPIDVFGKNALGEFAGDDITLKVQQTAALQSLEIDQDEIFIDLDWDGNIKGKSSGNFVTIYGIFSDGVKRILDDDPGTTYTSSDPSVISVDNKGNYQVHKAGQAAITISNLGISKVIPVVFNKPTGIRPLETIPPATAIDIQPSPNATGWHNQDTAITLTATDNEGGSGVKELKYWLVGLIAGMGPSEEQTVYGNTAQFSILRDGITRLGYYARDNERNAEDTQFADIKLDKTPPTTPLVTTKGEVVDSITYFKASWSSDEPQSSIAEYWYALGTSEGATDVLAWTSVGKDTAVSQSSAGLSLVSGTTYYFSVKAKNMADLWSDVGSSNGIEVFIRGDANSDGSVDIADAIKIIFYLFVTDTKVKIVAACDVNGDGKVNLTDAIYLLSFLFRSGQSPALPYPNPGISITG